MLNGGGGRIRTHGPLQVNGFQDRRDRPALPLLRTVFFPLILILLA